MCFNQISAYFFHACLHEEVLVHIGFQKLYFIRSAQFDAPTLRLNLLHLHMRTWLDPMELFTQLQVYHGNLEGWVHTTSKLLMSHVMRKAIVHLWVSSHHLHTYKHEKMPKSWEYMICQVCSMAKVETRDYYLFKCPTNNKIHGEFHHLFHISHTSFPTWNFSPYRPCATFWKGARTDLGTHVSSFVMATKITMVLANHLKLTH